MTKSETAIKLGFKVSLMQYLLENKKCYMRHPMTKRYDPNFITVLSQNYRSHPSILHIPNERFYDGMLDANGNKGMLMLTLQSEIRIRSFYL